MASTEFIRMAFADVKCGGHIVMRSDRGFIHLNKITEIPASSVVNFRKIEIQGTDPLSTKLNVIHQGRGGLTNYFYVREETIVAFVPDC